ncbi:Glycosyl hydrolases family 43 [Paraprevotella clara]|jgi:xylan 1,4-beta-xylosidase|uniref:Glycosyl hydrolases family 43 n=2 Tax=Paraprevotella clara TaxID=454154 RepID=A0A6N3BPZ9_9BACT
MKKWNHIFCMAKSLGVLSMSCVLLFLCGCKAQLGNGLTLCNPVDLSYRFSLKDSTYREAADPTMVYFKGEYYLFLSKSGGYFHSVNLVDWDLIVPENLPVEKYAPTVMEMDGELYFTASLATDRIYKTPEPKSGKWELVTDSFPMVVADPMLFYDEVRDKVFMYYGSGAGTPMMSVELDRKTFMPVSAPKKLFYSHADKYGWEVGGDHNTNYKHVGWMEGAWMTYHDGKYYLQYAVPGTEVKSYCNGVYVSDNPDGPFVLQPHNPFSYKPEGFVCGFGHGSTFQDRFGNYWNISTSTISQRHMFERRISLCPVFFDTDGTIYASTAWVDYPFLFPDRKVKSPQELFPGWMLLNYKKQVETSSSLEGHSSECVVDEDIRTWWSAETADEGEFLSVDLGKIAEIYAVQVNFADQGARAGSLSGSLAYRYLLEVSTDGVEWDILADKSHNRKDAPHEYIQLREPEQARYVRLTNVGCPTRNFSVSDFRVFGLMDKPLPQATEVMSAERNKDNRRRVRLEWAEVPDAIGYNVRFGVQPDKLFHHYIVYGDPGVTLNVLNADLPYYFAIDSFNEAGITEGKAIKFVP